MLNWIRARRASRAENRRLAQERYDIWAKEEIRRYGHIRSVDEIRGWCIDVRCMRTAPHAPHS